MHSKTKLNEAPNTFKLSELTTNDSGAADALPPKSADNNGLASLANNERHALRFLERAELASRNRPRATTPSINDTVFGWLKVIDGEPGDLTADEGSPRPNRSGLATTVGVHGGRSYTGAAAYESRFAGHHGTTEEDHGDEDNTIEQRLARKFVAQFDEPVNAPRPTFIAALMPYMAATGFFLFVAGGSALYYIADGSSSEIETTGNARAEPTAATDPQIAQAGEKGNIATRSAVNPNQKPFDDQIHSPASGVQRTVLDADGGPTGAVLIPVVAGVPGLESRLTAKAVEPAGKNADLRASATAKTSEANLEGWAETVETFKMFAGAKPIQQHGKTENSENELLLKRLEAWQDAKSRRE